MFLYFYPNHSPRNLQKYLGGNGEKAIKHPSSDKATGPNFTDISTLDINGFKTLFIG